MLPAPSSARGFRSGYLAKLSEDRCLDSLGLEQDLSIGEAQYPQAPAGEIPVTNSIVLEPFWKKVRCAIGLDAEALLEAEEVEDVGPELVLPAKLETGKPPVSQHVPESALGIGSTGAQPSAALGHQDPISPATVGRRHRGLSARPGARLHDFAPVMEREHPVPCPTRVEASRMYQDPSPRPSPRGRGGLHGPRARGQHH